MAMTHQEDSLYQQLCHKISTQLNINENYLVRLNNYYEQVKQLSKIKDDFQI